MEDTQNNARTFGVYLGKVLLYLWIVKGVNAYKYRQEGLVAPIAI